MAEPETTAASAGPRVLRSREARNGPPVTAPGLLFLVAVFLSLAMSSTPTAHAESGSDLGVLVKYADDVSIADQREVESRVGARRTGALSILRTAVLKVAAGRSEAVKSRLRADPAVERVEADVRAHFLHASCASEPACVIPDDPLFHRQWALQNDERTQPPPRSGPGKAGADVAAPLAWGIARADLGTVVAVVDSGVDADHPDLGGRVVEHQAFNGDADARDRRGHGTATAGAAAAIADNGVGIAGLSYGAGVMDLKVSSDDGAPVTCEVIARAVLHAAERGAEVINLSLGFYDPCQTLGDAIARAWEAGSLIVASAGNGGIDMPVYPAAFPEVIGVAATDNTDARVPSSQYGADFVDLAAPGAGVLTTMPTYENATGVRDYGYNSGTSISAPLVSGAAALIWGQVADTDGDGRLNDEVAERLFASADPIAGTGSDWRYGRLNACRAAAGAQDRCPPPSSAAPVEPPAAQEVESPPSNPPATQGSESVPAQPPISTGQPASNEARPAPTLTLSAARRSAQVALARRFGKRYRARRGGRPTCRRLSRASVICRATWRHGTRRYRVEVVTVRGDDGRLVRSLRGGARPT